MGTIVTIILSIVIIGYAVHTIRAAASEAKEGKCSGCSYGSCSSGKCELKN